MRSIRSMLFSLVILLVSGISSAQVFISVNFAPPALPVYEQPLCPAEGYLWEPGYWAWSSDGYYWVPGTWVLAPDPGLLWTPGYWAFDDGLYYWHPGYWGPVVGFYGGIPYGYGYPGTGYYGGYWRGNQLYYNQAVNNVNVTNVRNVYNTTVINTTTVNRVSYNGGPGGTTVRPTREEEAAARARHIPPTSAQIQHEHSAGTNRELFASVNQGRPPIAATPKPAEFNARGIVPAREAGAPYRAPENRAAPSRPSMTAPAPGNREENPSRTQTEPRMTPAPRSEAPRPPSASERENAPQREIRPPIAPERETRPENTPTPRREPPPPNREMHPDKRTPPPDREPPPPPPPQEERPN